MKKHVFKDKKVRNYFKKIEVFELNNKIMSRIKEKNFLFSIENETKNKHFDPNSVIKNRCVISNRKKCLHRKFRLSRIILRKSVNCCLILGLKKASF